MRIAVVETPPRRASRADGMSGRNESQHTTRTVPHALSRGMFSSRNTGSQRSGHTLPPAHPRDLKPLLLRSNSCPHVTRSGAKANQTCAIVCGHSSEMNEVCPNCGKPWKADEVRGGYFCRHCGLWLRITKDEIGGPLIDMSMPEPTYNSGAYDRVAAWWERAGKPWIP
jgi:DNA-directed RNA polymerase subunit RPC12/RpoP